MPEKQARVPMLVVDDDAATLEIIQEALMGEDLDIQTALGSEAGLEIFVKQRPRIVLVDLMMPTLTGMDLLERMLEKDPGVEVILMTGHYSTESAVEAIQRGARDYMAKPLNIEKLRTRISSLLAEVRQKETAFHLEGQLIEAFQFEGMIGRSP